MTSAPILSVRDLQVQFLVHQNMKWPWSRPGKLNAVNGVSFDLLPGQSLGIVGESGCGKSTLIRAICGLVKYTQGEVLLDGTVLDFLSQSSRLRAIRSMQMIFQDPVSSLNPRQTILEILKEPLRIFAKDNSNQAHEASILEMIERVGIARSHLNRFPHEFSGGQCQRIGIARALLAKPRILLCDEPVSALDVSIQAQILNLLKDLKHELGLSLVFIAHDLAVVNYVADEVLVLYLGSAMEYAKTDVLMQRASHPYSKSLLLASPVPDPKVKLSTRLIEGELPSPVDLPAGCFFASRCPDVMDICRQERPLMKQRKYCRVACHAVTQ